MLNTLQLLRQIDAINLNIHTHKSKAVLTYAAFEGKKYSIRKATWKGSVQKKI